MVTTRPPKTIVKPTALSPVANTDTKLLIYGLFQKGRVLAQDGMVLFGRNALERALREYRLHYLRERNHQGLGNRLLDDFPQDADGPSVECRKRLGGLLRYYYRAAA